MTDPSRRRQLLALKLAALARDNGGVDVRIEPGEFGPGAAAMAGARAWVLLDSAETVSQPNTAARGLGPAIAWAIRHQADSLQILAESATGTLARRAEQFTFPIDVAHIEGRVLLPAVAEPLPEPPPLPAGHGQFLPTIVAAGAAPAVEHGVLVGEVDGLEVCRVVTDAFSGERRR